MYSKYQSVEKCNSLYVSISCVISVVLGTPWKPPTDPNPNPNSFQGFFFPVFFLLKPISISSVIPAYFCIFLS